MMAGYRPKSLDELNSIFDKTMAAEKAIKKGSSLLEKGEDSFTSFSEEIKGSDESLPVTEKKPNGEITDSVSDFIAKFSAQAEKEQVKAKPTMTILSHEAPVKEFEIEAENNRQEAEEAAAEAERPSRDELFDEYARIMSDEEDDAPEEKKLSRKEKKRLRKKEKAESSPSHQETEAAVDAYAEEPSDSPEEVSEMSEENSFEEMSEQEAVTPFFVGEETEQKASSEKNDEFDFPENYTPDWIKEDEAEEAKEKKPKKKKVSDKKAVRTVLKVFLSLILIAVIGVGALATVFKTAVSVNTGKVISDKYYVFTTYKDYSDLGIGKGDLIITEKKYAEEGEVFVYVDYINKTFELGRRTDSITKEDGEVLYVTERESGRTLVSRDDCKGVLYLSYANYGDIVSFLTDNYIVIIAAAAVTSLIVVLIFALALRTKKEQKDNEEQEERETSEEYEENFEDIFSTIE